MKKKIKVSKIPDKDVAEMTQAAQFAAGNQTADEFFDDMLKYLPKYRKIFAERDQQTKSE